MERTVRARDIALGLVAGGNRVGATAAQLLLLPARAAGHLPVLGRVVRGAEYRLALDGRRARAQGRRRFEQVAGDVLAAPEVERAVDRALEGPLPDAVARSLAEHGVVERIAAKVLTDANLEEAVVKALEHETTEQLVREALASPGLRRLLVTALESELARELTDRVLEGPEMQRVVEHVAASPEVRAAVARQTTSLADEMVAGIRTRARRLDDSAEDKVRGSLRRPRRVTRGAPFAGLSIRAVALALDAVLAHVIFLTGAAMLGLVASLVGELRPAWLVGLLVAAGWVLVVGTYFVAFWTAAGQTPGMRLLRLRVLDPAGHSPSLGRSLLRLVGLGLSIAPMFAGFIPVLVDDRRRGLHDLLAGTVVVNEECESQTNTLGLPSAAASHVRPFERPPGAPRDARPST